ncbi:MAG: OB-fold domain-containing protein [Chloroflexi bacterium]|nr:OB-fold domain-containing protein [Chloroflexota bacterium]
MTQSDQGTAPTRVFTHYLNNGKLAYQYCQTCAAPVFYPRVLCPTCGGTALEWRVSSGRGTVYSTTTIYHRGKAPYNVVLVDLEEGFRMMSRVEETPSEEVRIGMAVRFAVQRSDETDTAVAVFVPERSTL